jgi:serine protease AprX
VNLKYRFLLSSLAGTLSFGAYAVAQPGPGHKLAEDLRSHYAAPASIIDVIVQFRKGAPGEAHLRVLGRGGILHRNLDLVRAKAYRIPADQLERLADDPDVEFVSPDRPVQATAFSGTPDYGWMTAMDATSSSVTLPYDGTGIGVAVIDSGIWSSKQQDLNDRNGKTRVVYEQSFVRGNTDVHDYYGHGTHVAGLIGGNGARSSGRNSIYLIRGIAPNVNLLNLRVLDNNGSGTDSSVIAAIQRAVQLQSQYNIRVINLSLGRPVSASYVNDPLCQAVQEAWNAGIVVVVAAGNDGRNNSAGTNGYATIDAPGNSPYAITVGAMNTLGTPARADDKITSYSSKGPTLFDHVVKPDLVAPGNRISSVESYTGAYLATTYPQNNVPQSMYLAGGGSATNWYYQLSGTSMAAPMVSGAAALLVQKKPPSQARPGKGHSDEDGLQVRTDQQCGYGPCDWDFLHQPVRHLHRGRRLSRHSGCARE